MADPIPKDASDAQLGREGRAHVEAELERQRAEMIAEEYLTADAPMSDDGLPDGEN